MLKNERANQRRCTTPSVIVRIVARGWRVDLDLIREETDRVAIHAQVVLPGRLVLPIDRQHLKSADLVERVGSDAARAAFDARDAVLTVAFTTRGAVR